MGDERDRDRKRAAVMVSMLVPAYQMQDAAAIAAAAGEILGDPEAILPGSAVGILRGLENAGLVRRREYAGRDTAGERTWLLLTEEGRYAAQVMRGVMGGEDGTRVVIPEEAIDRYVATRIPPLAGGGGEDE